jgi:DNA-binding CsgD family transcriptional regulator
VPADHRSSLIGRDAELASVDKAIATVAGGDGAVLAIVGDAGIGKTALLTALRDRAEAAGLLALAGRGAEHEREVPFGVVIDALDDHVATMHERRVESLGAERAVELAAVLPAVAEQHRPEAVDFGPAQRFRYHRALAALLELIARERPVALILDDVHWADEASLELILHLLRRPPRGPLLFAFALRPVDPLPRLLDALRGTPEATRVTLEPLPREAGLELLAEVPDSGLRDKLEEEAGGNPLYLQELARAAQAPGGSLPETLVAAVELEVGSLPAGARELLRGAAVAGDPFDPELAATAAGIDSAAALTELDLLTAANLVRPAGGSRGFRFRHPVVRRAVYDAAPAGWRLGAHERASNALAERGAPATQRAYHVAEAARPGDDEAIAVLREAAVEGGDANPAAAARWWEAALRLLPADDPRRVEVLAPLAIALASSGRLADARDILIEATALMPPEPAAVPLAMIGLTSSIDHVLGRHGEAQARVRAALAELPRDAAVESRAALEFELAAGSAFMQDAEELVESAGRASETAAAGHLRVLRAAAEALLAMGAMWSGDAQRGLDAASNATAGLRALSDEECAARPDAAYYVGMAQLASAHYGDVIETSARGLDIVRRYDFGAFLGPMEHLRAMALYNFLRPAEARHHLEVCEDTARLQGLDYQLEWALWMKALVADAEGDPVVADQAAAECREVMERTTESMLTRVGKTALGVVTASRDPERAIAEMVADAGPELDQIDLTWSTWLLTIVVRAAVEAGDLDGAERWCRLLERRAAELGVPASEVRADIGRANMLLAGGEGDAAAALALPAADRAEELDIHVDAVAARLCAGRALKLADRQDEAVEQLRAVAEKTAAGGHVRLHDAAARELRALGVRLQAGASRAAETGGLEVLSEREREIAELVAQGRSNKEVGVTLYLSAKTIENHLSRIYGKLGVRSRVELTALLVRER